LCADIEQNALNGDHTDPRVGRALVGASWLSHREWSRHV